MNEEEQRIAALEAEVKKLRNEGVNRRRWYDVFDTEWTLLLAFVIVITIIQAIVKISGH